MGTNEIITHSNPEKTSSIVQEQPSVHPYPHWASMKTYYGPGVPIPTPYFSSPVYPGHTHPYMWSPQPMLTPFGRQYTEIYPHGGQSLHPSAINISSHLNLEVPIIPSINKEISFEKKVKVLHNLAAGSNGNKLSESGDDGAEGSSNGSDMDSEFGSERRRCPEVLPCSVSEAPTISLGMSSDPDTITGKPCTVFRVNLTPGMDLRSSYVDKLEPGGECILPTSDSVAEKELKKEKRKQSNRESAKRSRLRKQAETEELAIKFGTLTAENTALRSEITWLTESSDKLRFENSALMKKLKMVQSKEKNVMVPDRINYDDSPSIMIKNLLSRIDNSDPVREGNQMEDERHENFSGKLHELLDANPQTDSVVAS